MTVWENRFSESNPFGFIVLFILGLVAGLIAVWFLARIPETEGAKKEKDAGFNFSLFFQPLKDRNFLTLILFVSAWMFAIQLAAPFYGVFMIENLKINFSNILLATLSVIFLF